jgi:hypothetical protein
MQETTRAYCRLLKFWWLAVEAVVEWTWVVEVVEVVLYIHKVMLCIPVKQ